MSQADETAALSEYLEEIYRLEVKALWHDLRYLTGDPHAPMVRCAGSDCAVCKYMLPRKANQQ